MAPGANSYGTVEDVAALTRVYTNSGNYFAFTNPTLEAVEGWIDSASATVNVALAKAGFKIPVTQADAKEAIAGVVVSLVADLCHAANSTGRFFTERALASGVSPMRAVRKELADWVEDQAPGLEALGATRTSSLAAGICFRETDQAGDPVPPLFERKQFGDRQEEWDR